MDPALGWSAIGLQLFTLRLFLESLFLLRFSVRCGTWLTASWHTKRPPIIWMIRPIGLAIFRRKADRFIGCRWPRARVIRMGLLHRCGWTRWLLAGFKSYPGCGTCLDRR